MKVMTRLILHFKNKNKKLKGLNKTSILKYFFYGMVRLEESEISI